MKVFFTLMLTVISSILGADGGGFIVLDREYCDRRLEDNPDSYVEIRGPFRFGGMAIQFDSVLLAEILQSKVTQHLTWFKVFQNWENTRIITAQFQDLSVRSPTIGEKILGLGGPDFILNDNYAIRIEYLMESKTYMIQCSGAFEEKGILIYDCTSRISSGLNGYFIPYRDIHAIGCKRKLRHSVNMLRRRYSD